MLFLRLKQCEVALGAGRLDEAFELLCSPDVRSHRRGQDLLDRLGAAMVERGRSHLAASRFEAAAQDCERAARLLGNAPDVLALRTAVSEAMAARRRADRRRNQIAAAVRQHMNRGELTLGHALLAADPAADQNQTLRGELADRRATVQAVAQTARAALGAGRWEAAVDSLTSLDRGLAAHPEIRDLCAAVSASIVTDATAAIESGRLDRAAGLLRRHSELPGQFIEATRLQETLRQFQEAAHCVQRADAAEAERILAHVSGQWPRASWIADALGQVRRLRESAEAALAGPLGTMSPPAVPGSPGADCVPPATHPQCAPQRNPDADFVLHVDGAGGFRVIGAATVTIGPASASRPVDVAVAGDAATTPVVTITRSDEDYFIQSSRPIEVNDQPTTRALLANDDRIAVGPRCRLRFRRPNPASASAVLDVIAGRFVPGDVRRLILLDRELIIGPGPAAHVRVDSLAGPALLQQRGAAALACRAADPVMIDGRPAGTECLITPGMHVTIGTVGLVLVREGEVRT